MQTRPRVLHLIEDLGTGGAERLLYINLSWIDRSCFENAVCHLYDRALHWRQPLQDLGYPVWSLGMSSLFDAGRGTLNLYKLLRRERIDLIHTHLYGANLVGRLAGRLRRIPVISSLHNPDYEPSVLQDNPRLSPVKLNMLRMLDRVSCAIGHPRFIAVSDYVRRSAITFLGIPPARAQVIYNAVDPKDFEPTERSGRLRAELGIGMNDPVVLCVARLDPQKGLRYLIDATPALVSRFPSLRVLLVGGGPPAIRDSLVKLAERSGVAAHVMFLGIQPNVQDYLQLCDVFVLPSLYEGLGIALVEAMAAGRPCVATRVGAIPEVVDEGRSGMLVSPGDPAGLATAITRLLEAPALRREMGEGGRRIVLERFNVHRNIQELEELYRRVLKTRSHGQH